MTFGLGRLGAGFGRLGRVSAGGVHYSAAAAAFFARLATQPSAVRKTQYDAMIKALVSAGVWAKLDAFYLLAAADQATALTNLVQSSYGATGVNSPSFAADSGFTSAATAYLDTGFNATTAGGQFIQNSASIFTWSAVSAQRAAQLFEVSGGNTTGLYGRFTDNTMYARLNVAADGTAASTDGSGFWTLSRTASAGYEVYRNGVSFASITATSAALSSGNFIVGKDFVGLFYMAGFGSGLTSADQIALYNAVHTHLQAVAGIG